MLWVKGVLALKRLNPVGVRVMHYMCQDLTDPCIVTLLPRKCLTEA